MDFTTLLFWVLAALTACCAIGVVVTQNIVRSATWLLFTLAGTSAVFFLLGADFVGATQLLVYVGGTLVLVVFGVMLTAQGPFINLKTGAAEWAISTLVGLLLYGVLSASILISPRERNTPSQMDDPVVTTTTAALGETLLGIKQAQRPAKLRTMGFTLARDRTPMGYLLPFEIVSVHLLVVLIGAAYLARAKRRRGVVG